MTWKRVLAALARGGWATDLEHEVPHWTNTFDVERVSMTCTRGEQVVALHWVGTGRKFDGATLDGETVTVEQLGELLEQPMSTEAVFVNG